MVRKLIMMTCAMLLSGAAWAENDVSRETEAEALPAELEEQLDALDGDVAEDGDSSTSDRNWRVCRQYNQYGYDARYYCSQDYRCWWNGYSCDSAQGGGGGGGGYRCERIQDWRTCRDSGCYWDNYYGCSASGGGGGGGNQGVWQCTAQDSGWEEHWGGHTAQGYSQNQAARAALGICQQSHGRCTVTSCNRVY